MPRDRRHLGIPTNLGIEMGMKIDKTRRDIEAVGLDLFPALIAYHPNFADLITVDRNIRLVRGLTGPINHVPTSNHYVVCHESRLCTKLKY